MTAARALSILAAIVLPLAAQCPGDERRGLNTEFDCDAPIERTLERAVAFLNVMRGASTVDTVSFDPRTGFLNGRYGTGSPDERKSEHLVIVQTQRRMDGSTAVRAETQQRNRLAPSQPWSNAGPMVSESVRVAQALRLFLVSSQIQDVAELLGAKTYQELALPWKQDARQQLIRIRENSLKLAGWTARFYNPAGSRREGKYPADADAPPSPRYLDDMNALVRQLRDLERDTPRQADVAVLTSIAEDLEAKQVDMAQNGAPRRIDVEIRTMKEGSAAADWDIWYRWTPAGPEWKRWESKRMSLAPGTYILQARRKVPGGMMASDESKLTLAAPRNEPVPFVILVP